MDEKMTYPLTITGNEPVFLCSWNEGEIVEIHTRKTLWEQYKDSGLYNPEDDGWGWEMRELMQFEALLDRMETDPFERETVFTNENMTIQRIR